MLLSLIALATAHQSSPPIPAPDAPRLMNQPAISGDHLIFSYASDLWSWNIDGKHAAVRLTSGYGNKAYPFVSPDGKTIAYDAGYDGATAIYTIPIEGGTPTRVTYDNTPDVVLGWTPDNKIAFINYGTNPYLMRQGDLYEVSPDGSLPTPTSLREVGWASFFSTGNKIAFTRQASQRFNWRRYRGGSQGVVATYDLSTNRYAEIPHGREQQFFPMAVGSNIYFVSDKGDGVLNLYKYSSTTKQSQKLTNFTGEDIKWANTDGKNIVFNQDGYVWIYNIKTGDYHTVSPVINADNLLTRPRLVKLSNTIDSFDISPSGARLAVESRGEIFSVPQKSGVTRDQTNTQGTREQNPCWSPDGATIAYISDASGETEIYTMPQMGLKPGEKPTQLTHLGKTILTSNGGVMAWSPDSKKILFGTIDQGLYTVDVTTKEVKEIAHPEYGYGSADWSPDSRWIAYIEGKSTSMTSIHMYEVATGKDTEVINGDYSNQSVAFDTNGKYLYVISGRSIHPSPGLYGPSLKVTNPYQVFAITLSADTPDPLGIKDNEEKPAGEAGAPMGMMPPPGFRPGMPMMRPGQTAGGKPGEKPSAPAGPPPIKVDLAGFADRMILIPLPADGYVNLIGGNDGVFIQDRTGLIQFSFASKRAEPVIMAPGGRFAVNASRTMVAYEAGGVFGEIPVGGPPAAVGEGAINTSGLQYVIDPKAEWNEIYWEAWRFIRDNYYDKDFRGQNWKAVGDHYATYLPWLRTRSDLNVVLGLLLSELGTSHCYVEGLGDLGGTPPIPVPTGYLGADYAITDGHIQFKKIYTGHQTNPLEAGPLGAPGLNVKPGDYLLAIDGQPLGTTNPAQALLGKAGQPVALLINSKPSDEGARTILVRPIGTENTLRYLDFIDHAKALVDQLSDGKIGYMHLRDTETNGSDDFARAFEPQTNKEAMIIDERWNGGGYPDPQFIEKLAFKSYSWGQSRNSGDQPITPSLLGPEAMLINGYAGSGGDLLPWTFREARLGPLIGMRTWGGLVGIGAGADLVDGGSISTPSFSVYNPKTMRIIAENHGIDPDIQVDNSPDLVAKGEDPQLIAAVNYLLDQLKKIGAPFHRNELPHVSQEGQLDLPKDIYKVKH